MLICLIETIKIACKTQKITISEIVFLSCSARADLFLSGLCHYCYYYYDYYPRCYYDIAYAFNVDGRNVFVLKCVQYVHIYACHVCLSVYLTSNQLTLNINYNLSMSLVYTYACMYVKRMSEFVKTDEMCCMLSHIFRM